MKSFSLSFALQLKKIKKFKKGNKNIGSLPFVRERESIECPRRSPRVQGPLRIQRTLAAAGIARRKRERWHLRRLLNLLAACSRQQFLRCAKYTPGSAARWLGTCRGGCELPLNSIYKLRAPCLYVAAGHGTEAVSGTRAGHRGAGKGGGESRRMDSDTAASGIGALRSTRGRVAWPWPSMCVRVQDRVSRSAKPVLHEARQHCKKSYVKSNKCCGLCVTKTYDSTKNL